MTRLEAAIQAVESVGSALLKLRGAGITGQESDRQQLKTPIDLAAEGWVAGFLHGLFPHDLILAEEACERSGSKSNPYESFWTIDALDGSRSFVEGFPGFCAQVAYVDKGHVSVGAVYEPVAGNSYWASAGEGAFMRASDGTVRQLTLQSGNVWPNRPRFVDSTPPKGAIGRMMQHLNGELIVCGSIGVKICRVAEGVADVFAKELSFAVWDAAPGGLILEEAGGLLGLWNGDRVSFDSPQIYYNNILATPAGLFEPAVRELQ
jgi:fructose-1,6-bisphosphatase/inositol monophosphatase family enzyme